MQVQLNTDSNIEGSEELAAHVSGVVTDLLDGMGEQVTRVEVHLSDQDGKKGGPDDKRCMMEARIAGHQPTSVTHSAATLDEAVAGAAGKLARVVESALREDPRSAD